jgi:transposase
VLRFLPTYCPHLDPIERLWGLMHQNITHNRDFKTFHEFRRAVIDFLRDEVPQCVSACKIDPLRGVIGVQN